MCSPDVMRQIGADHSATRPTGRNPAPDRTERRRLPWPSRRGLLGFSGIGAVAALTALLPVGTATAYTTPGRTNRVTDLTHTLTPDFPLYPGYAPPSFEPTATIEEDGFRNYRMNLEEHSGTHLDAPAHFALDGDTVDAIPAERLVAPLRVVRIVDRAREDPNATVTVADLRAHERRHGRIPRGAVVAMDSGWSALVGDSDAFLGLDDAGGLNFPGFSAEAAEFLTGRREIVGVGVDTLSLDPGNSEDFAAHAILLGAGVYGIENLNSLAAVPDSGATVVVGAPRHGAGSGGPTRVLALR